MRLFIALRFTDEIVAELSDAVAALRAVSSRGTFTAEDNLHLTLAFIGETDRSRDVISVIDSISCRPFGISLSRPGVFRRDGGDIRWVGIKADATLDSLVSDLREGLIASGFEIDTRPFRPHITLGRQVVCPSDTRISVRPLSMTADGISLMRSDRVGGVLRYTEIYRKSL